MKTIIITEDTEDLRPNRDYTLRKETELTTSNYWANQYIEKGVAKEFKPDFTTITIKNAEQAKKYEEDNLKLEEDGNNRDN